MIFLLIIAIIVAAIFIGSYICFYLTFYVSDSMREEDDDYILPLGKAYEPYHAQMLEWMKETRNIPHEEFVITSFDGLKLYGKYYQNIPGAPIELMMHGYRGTAQRDLCGGVQRCFSLGRNAFVVDQRAAGKSQGKVISFGINERKDCLSWIEYLIEHFGKEVKIILTGISMGAATVMMASGFNLPENVIGIVADCGYTSPRDIIRKVISNMGLPASVIYPFVRLGAKLFGHFNLEEVSATEALKSCNIPIVFIHGDADTFVPCYMSEINYAACTAPKELLIVKGAGHGLSYLKNKNAYIDALRRFDKFY